MRYGLLCCTRCMYYAVWWETKHWYDVDSMGFGMCWSWEDTREEERFRGSERMVDFEINNGWFMTWTRAEMLEQQRLILKTTRVDVLIEKCRINLLPSCRIVSDFGPLVAWFDGANVGNWYWFVLECMRQREGHTHETQTHTRAYAHAHARVQTIYWKCQIYSTVPIYIYIGETQRVIIITCLIFVTISDKRARQTGRQNTTVYR